MLVVFIFSKHIVLHATGQANMCLLFNTAYIFKWFRCLEVLSPIISLCCACECDHQIKSSYTRIVVQCCRWAHEFVETNKLPTIKWLLVCFCFGLQIYASVHVNKCVLSFQSFRHLNSIPYKFYD